MTSAGKICTFTDGASRGNPGLAGVGVLIFDEHDKTLVEDYKFLGTCTNNEAEYQALLLALERAAGLTTGVVECYMDSQLVARQMTGQYKLKAEHLRPLLDEARRRAGRFSSCTFHHVPREHPKLRLVDKLANRAIDERNG